MIWKFGYRLAKLIGVQNIEQGDHYPNLPLPVKPEPVNTEPTPNDPPWGVPAALGVWVASVLFILFIPVFFLLPYLAMQKPPITESSQIVEFAKNDSTSIFLQILAVLPAHILTIILAWMVATRVRKYSFRNILGWQTGGFAWWYYVLILGGFFTLAILVNALVPEQENDLIRMLQSSRSVVYLVAFVATFTAPLVEEVVYRGLLYSAFQRKFGVTRAFVVVTLMFAAVHVPQYWPSYSTIFLLGVLSLTLTAIRVKTNNLLPCIILHTIFNGFQSVMLIVEPYLKTSEVQEQAAAILLLLK